MLKEPGAAFLSVYTQGRYFLEQTLKKRRRQKTSCGQKLRESKTAANRHLKEIIQVSFFLHAVSLTGDEYSVKALRSYNLWVPWTSSSEHIPYYFFWSFFSLYYQFISYFASFTTYIKANYTHTHTHTHTHC